MAHLAIFASGTGSNALKIIERLQPKYPTLKISVWSNKATAPILEKAQSKGLEVQTFGRQEFYGNSDVLNRLKSQKVDLIVLAGFLWLVPSDLVKEFSDKIVNIHPALLPKYGGKGMYGMNVHKAVKEAKEVESGITIHLVNEEYDQGEHILQASCAISPEDMPEDIAKKVLGLEHQYFPEVVDELLAKMGV